MCKQKRNQFNLTLTIGCHRIDKSPATPSIFKCYFVLVTFFMRAVSYSSELNWYVALLYSEGYYIFIIAFFCLLQCFFCFCSGYLTDVVLKGARSYFLKFSFVFQLKNYYSEDVNSKFLLKRSTRLDVRSEAILCIAVTHSLLCKLMVTLHKHVFIHIFPTEAVKLDMGCEEIWAFL